MTHCCHFGVLSKTNYMVDFRTVAFASYNCLSNRNEMKSIKTIAVNILSMDVTVATATV